MMKILSSTDVVGNLPSREIAIDAETDMSDRITSLYELEVANDKLARERQDIPINYSKITPEWLSAVMCGNNPGAKVVSLRLGAEDDGTTNRRRIYIEYNQAGQQAGLAKSVFCKASQALSSRLTLGVIGATHAEHTFFTKVRPELDIAAPEALWANYDPQSYNSIVVFRDLGGEVEFCDYNSPINWERAVSMILLLAKFHSRFYNHPDLGGARLPFALWTDWFPRLEAVGMEEYTNKGLVAAEHVIPNRLFAKRDQIWPATIASVERHKDLPHSVLHSDVHLRNWYYLNDKQMGLADWQAVCVGNWSRDFAYAVSCCLAIDDRRAWERELLQIYLDAMQAGGAPKIAFDEAFLLHRQQIFSALAYWTVTLTPPPVMPPDMQPEAVSLAFIERFTTAIDDLDSLTAFESR